MVGALLVIGGFLTTSVVSTNIHDNNSNAAIGEVVSLCMYR